MLLGRCDFCSAFLSARLRLLLMPLKQQSYIDGSRSKAVSRLRFATCFSALLLIFRLASNFDPAIRSVVRQSLLRS
jgi:hypothetical protein